MKSSLLSSLNGHYSTRKFHLLVNGNESDENVQTSSPKDHLIFFKNHIEKVKIVENRSQCTFIMLRSIVRGMLMVLISATLIEMSALLSTKSWGGGGGCFYQIQLVWGQLHLENPGRCLRVTILHWDQRSSWKNTQCCKLFRFRKMKKT